MSAQPSDRRTLSRPASNLTIACLGVVVGCLSLALIAVALIVGLWLDGLTGARGPFTIGLLLLVIPLSLILMVRLTLSAIKRIPFAPMTVRARNGLHRRGVQQEEEGP